MGRWLNSGMQSDEAGYEVADGIGSRLAETKAVKSDGHQVTRLNGVSGMQLCQKAFHKNQINRLGCLSYRPRGIGDSDC